jgi:hypothetical protein
MKYGVLQNISLSGEFMMNKMAELAELAEGVRAWRRWCALVGLAKGRASFEPLRENRLTF